MKLSFTLTSILALLLLSASQCRKNKSSNSDVQLPAETTIGANTFGCKVNGKVFVPRDGNGKPGLFVQYENLGMGQSGGWHLNIPATNWQPNPPVGVNIETDSLLLGEGITYNFKNAKGYPRAFYQNGDVYPKIDSESGSLHITKFDQVKHILSGTFSFVGTNSNGEKVSVTDGRFDLVY